MPAAGLSILLVLLFISLSVSVSQSSIFSYEHNNTADNPSSTTEIAREGSNEANVESVSNSDTSSANTVEQTNFYKDIPGVGAFFGQMLDSLINLTKNTENRFQSLTHHLPLVFPDLYKVLITL
jgi:hypothetical protein